MSGQGMVFAMAARRFARYSRLVHRLFRILFGFVPALFLFEPTCSGTSISYSASDYYVSLPGNKPADIEAEVSSQEFLDQVCVHVGIPAKGIVAPNIEVSVQLDEGGGGVSALIKRDDLGEGVEEKALRLVVQYLKLRALGFSASGAAGAIFRKEPMAYSPLEKHVLAQFPELEGMIFLPEQEQSPLYPPGKREAIRYIVDSGIAFGYSLMIRADGSMTGVTFERRDAIEWNKKLAPTLIAARERATARFPNGPYEPWHREVKKFLAKKGIKWKAPHELNEPMFPPSQE